MALTSDKDAIIEVASDALNIKDEMQSDLTACMGELNDTWNAGLQGQMKTALVNAEEAIQTELTTLGGQMESLVTLLVEAAEGIGVEDDEFRSEIETAAAADNSGGSDGYKW